MMTFDEFKNGLRALLAHLYDPTYESPEQVAMGFGELAQCAGDPKQMVIRAIKDLEPAADVPAHARAWRLYRLLSLRYLEQLTQEEVAQRLAITVRHLAREQAQAIELLAAQLWKVADGRVPTDGRPGSSGVQPPAQTSGVDSPASVTRSLQLEQELASLHERAPDTVSDIEKALREAIGVTSVLASKQETALSLGSIEPAILAAIHPSILGQALVAAITYIVRGGTASGQIVLSAERAADQVVIVVEGGPTNATVPPEDWLVRELVASEGGRVECQVLEGGLCFHITVPATRSVSVLVVDDNEDLVHYYSLCTAGTVYRLASVNEGRRVFESIETLHPDILVLDLMLPDMDGWELLAQLHEHPVSRSIPVVVCSVVREEELAFALGAAVCVTKPVQRRQFLHALERALNQVAAAGPKAGDSNAAPC